MEKLKWFAGGKERKEQAVTLITELLSELKNDPKSYSLQKLLINYQEDLERQQTAIPYILSRMTMDISSVIRKEEITLSKDQSDKLKQLISLLNIRYGY
ncbi:bacteriocin immunity protein [Vagococcus elongatus]|uniref:Bacteriocin immunity protein n=1 Tax=Vagococcus elongatus TaxID=180344 RepID=A0A430AV14_9ENTE|nr:bacteriocin immunity protein [Vagococcus elongatus]RSU11885.1 bacteriocin immunity protein [Vagococcus elongatus]